MGEVRLKLDRGAIVLTIFTECVHIHKYSNIQSHSSLSSFHDPSTNFGRSVLSYSCSFVQHVCLECYEVGGNASWNRCKKMITKKMKKPSKTKCNC